MSVCIGDGLTFDDDGKLIVDEGLLAYGTIARTTTLNVPAGAANTTVNQKILYNTEIEPPVGLISINNELEVVSGGLYLMTMCQGDNVTENWSNDPTKPVTIGIQIRVNVDQVAANRLERDAPQTHILSTSRQMTLAPGDIIQGWFNTRRKDAVIDAHPLEPDDAFVLSVVQLSTQYVKPVA